MQINIYFDNSENTEDFDIVDEWLKKNELHDVIQTFWIDSHEDSKGIDDVYGLTQFPVMMSVVPQALKPTAKIYGAGVEAILNADLADIKADLAKEVKVFEQTAGTPKV